MKENFNLVSNTLDGSLSFANKINKLSKLFYVESNHIEWKIKTLLYPFKQHKFNFAKEEMTYLESLTKPELSQTELFLPTLGLLTYVLVESFLFKLIREE